MAREPDWDSLQRTSLDWLRQASAVVRESQATLTNAQTDVVLLAAAYCLRACQDHFETAFDTFKSGRPYAGIASLRPAVETGFVFLWCTINPQEARGRLQRWMADTLTREKQLLENLSKTSYYSGDSASLEAPKQALAEMINRMESQSNQNKMPSVEGMLQDVEKHLNGAVKVTDDYPTLYRYMCASAHPSFSPERYFTDDNGVAVRIERPSPPIVTPWIILTAAFHIARGVFLSFNWDYSHMETEYEEAVTAARDAFIA